MNTVTTNVPGPQPLYCFRRRLLEAYPCVPLANNMRIGVAIFSYDGGIYVGATGDYDNGPDVDVVCRGVERGLEQLVAPVALQGWFRPKTAAAQRGHDAK